MKHIFFTLIIISVFFIVPASATGNLTVHYLDVGQGDAELLLFNNTSMLIDCGNYTHTKALLADLKSNNVSELDYLVITHPHSDHTGAFLQIKKHIKIKHTITGKEVSRGSIIALDPALCVKVLNPDTGDKDSINDDSIVLKVIYKNVSFLFMGDAGISTEKELLKSKYSIDSDILKVGHHGSKHSSSKAFIRYVSPNISIIEVGKGNVYHHPDKTVLRSLEKISYVYRTDQNGNIVITTDGNNYYKK